MSKIFCIFSEYIIGNILARERGMLRWHEKQQQRVWDSEDKYPRRLSDLTVGVCASVRVFVHACVCVYVGDGLLCVVRARVCA